MSDLMNFTVFSMLYIAIVPIIIAVIILTRGK